MVAIADAIKVLFPNATPRNDWDVVQDGSGVQTISKWNVALLGAQPSDAALAAVTQAQVDAAKLSKRDADLATLIDNGTTMYASLQSIRDATSPTNAQVIAAVKELARVQQFILRALRTLATRAV